MDENAEVLAFWSRRNHEDDVKMQSLSEQYPDASGDELLEALDSGEVGFSDPGALKWAREALCGTCGLFDCHCTP